MHSISKQLQLPRCGPCTTGSVVHCSRTPGHAGYDDDPHPIWREQEEVPPVLEEMEEGGCMDIGNNKWWTKWLGVLA